MPLTERKSGLFALSLLLEFVLLGLMMLHVGSAHKESARRHAVMRGMVKRFELTDLCLFTDARYTRNPSMADRHTPCQDYPLSLEHFPSGSIIRVPPHLTRQTSTLSPP